MKISVHWYRHGLRLHDNPALTEAVQDADEFYPVFIFDGNVAGTYNSGFNRWRFLHESLQDLDSSFRKVGGRVFVFQGDPVSIFSELFKEWSVTHLTFEQDPEPIWNDRDMAVKKLCEEMNVEWVERVSHTLWEPHLIISKNNGSPPLTHEAFCNVIQMIGEPERPVDDVDLSKVNIPVLDIHDNKFGLPSLEELGVKPECDKQLNRFNEWLGGETQALKQLAAREQVEEKAFESNQILPNQFTPDLLSPPMSLSAHLRFGCLSVRRFYWSVCDRYKKVKNEKPPLAITSQLIWREYFYTMSVDNLKYNQIEGNPICLNIPWGKDEEKLERWKTGRTGYPWIDACMIQVMEEGWIHHVARHAVACFLTRGDLWLSWEHGDKFFNRFQLDADWSVCAGNWMWISSSAFEKALDCPRCFCPVRYGMTMDPTGEYVRRYLPVLRDMPLKYLFNPWKAPQEVQEEAKCVIGVDYPEPIVDHREASRNNRQKIQSFLASLTAKDSCCGPSDDKEVRQFAWLPKNNPDLCNRCLK